MNYLPVIPWSNKRVIKRFGKEIKIKNDSKNPKNVTVTIAKIIPVVTKYSSTNFQTLTSSLWERSSKYKIVVVSTKGTLALSYFLH